MLYPVPHPTVLTGHVVELRPLEKEHFEELITLSKDERIWEFYSLNGGNTDTLRNAMETGLHYRAAGEHYPFAIYHKADGKLIGSTRFTDIVAGHNKLEIGWTWLHPNYWAGPVNYDCKLQLLTYAFETLGVYRVQLRTDVLNIRSAKAIEKIGGVYEGTIRNDMTRENGTRRHSMYFGLIAEEWPQTKAALIEKLEARLNP